jgi:hypothetical protein
MKNIIISFLGLSLIAFCCSTSLHTQSSENDLDQVELMNQFIGAWVAEIGEDSTVVWEVIPLGKGYEQIISWKAKEETFRTDKGIIGFTPDGYIGMLFLWSGNANLSIDIGQFVSENNAIFERNLPNQTHIHSLFNFSFITPDKLMMKWQWRGSKKTWDEAIPAEWIWTRVKE